MNLNDLGNTPLAEVVDMNNLPEQRGGGRAPAPPSGTYRFELPRLKPEAFGAVQSEKHGARIKVQLRDEFPLTIVNCPPAAKDNYLNAPFETTITNVPMRRGKGDDAPLVSDMDYLNAALGVKERPKTNVAFAQALITISQATPAPQFDADIEGNYRCDDKRDAYFSDGNGSYIPVPKTEGPEEAPVPVLDHEGKPVNEKGCGSSFYEGEVNKQATADKMGSIGKVNGAYPNSIECPNCQARLYRNANLKRFKAVTATA